MVFKAEGQIDIPTKDILSYIFDKPEYDENKPVSVFFHSIISGLVLAFTVTF